MLDAVARPAGDVLSRTVRVNFGGREYALAVLFIAGNERWRAYMDERTAAFVDAMAATGDDLGEIARKFTGETDMWLDILYAYDTDLGRQAGVLPPRDELKELIHEDEVEPAIREVVKAANPKAAVRLTALRAIPSAPTSSSSPRGGSRRKRRAGH